MIRLSKGNKQASRRGESIRIGCCFLMHLLMMTSIIDNFEEYFEISLNDFMKLKNTELVPAVNAILK